VDVELKELIGCPKCKKGSVIHAGGAYFCNNKSCDFIILGNMFGKKITKTNVLSLVRNKYIEPILRDLEVYPGQDTVNGFITLSKYNKVEFTYPNKLPIVRCPKCRQHEMLMRYSEKNNSMFYACEDYKKCKFTIPYIFREKSLSFRNIKRLCRFEKITKTFTSKTKKSYTVEVFLNKKDFKLSTNFNKR